MASLNISVSAASPLITYTGNWAQQISNNPNGTFSYSEARDATATFKFAGTWVRVMGSKNKYHGEYTVSLDGEDYNLNASTESDALHTPIFGQNLLNEQHTLVIKNTQDMTLNIHSIQWACDLGPQNVNASLERLTLDDNDPSISYSEDGSWSTEPENLDAFEHGTGHSTSTVNASVNFTFTGTRNSFPISADDSSRRIGDAIAIYGTTGPGHARYKASNSRSDQTASFDAERREFSPNVLLYFANGFGPGNNTVTLTTETPGLFQIDSAQVHVAKLSQALAPAPITPTLLSSSAQSAPTLPPDPNLAHFTRLSNGAIAGISFTAILVGFLSMAIWLLLRRNKRLWMRLQRGYMVQSQFDPHSPPSGVTPLIASRSATPQMHQTQPLLPTHVQNASSGSRRTGTIRPLPQPPQQPTAAAAEYPDDDEFVAPYLGRAETNMSQLTASTLVAEAGSDITRRASRYGLKPLQLATRWGSSTGSLPTAATSSSRDRDRDRDRDRGSRSTGRGSNRQYSPWLRPDSEFYDPFAATIAGLEEVPEEHVDDILRHPIQRHARGPSDGSRGNVREWQAALP
ncbi:hypothetical protein MKEN_00857600 [Mycena kentingensis (nom. inval.)]|nr:hypothetical protein MKEN_00857600 [Mycena kentingensis (nom. inval.)]